MSRSRVQYIRLNKGISREDVVISICFGMCMVGLIVLLWMFTSWEICKVLFGALLISSMLAGLAVIIVSENREYQFRKECMRIRSERTFYNIVLKGELTETPIEGTDLVEIRNVVAKI